MRTFHLAIAACLAASLYTLAADHDERSIPEGATALLADDVISSMQFVSGGAAISGGRLVDVEGQAFKKAFEIHVKAKPAKPWDVALYAPFAAKVRSGDLLLLAVTARMLQSEDESGMGVMEMKVDHSSPPWHSALDMTPSVTAEWQTIYAPGRAHRSMPDGKARVSLRFGYLPQTIQIGAMQLYTFGPDQDPRQLPITHSTYAGREPDADWRAYAESDIEKHRKANLSISVRDTRGVPIVGAAVSVEMQRHAFGFGCVVNPDAMWAEGPDGERYRDTVAKYFNKAPTESGFRWQNWTRGTPEQIAERKEQLGRTLDWLVEHDIETRGHYLMWAPLEARNKPPELLDKRDELLAAFWKHAEEKARWGGERVSEWDAINHIVGWNVRFADVYGQRIYADVIKRAREWVPHAEMWVNEGQVLVGDGTRIMSYHRIIQKLKKAGAAPDGIGFMGHFRSGGLPHPEEIYRRLSFFGNEIPKLQLTELDVNAGLDEQLHADYLRDVMTVAFSHPAVEAVVMWGFWEGRHWIPDAALWRKDWSIKPAGQVWRDLVFDRWWTNAEGTSDTLGLYRVPAFLGTHKVTVTHDGKTRRFNVDLPAKGKTVVVNF